MTFFENDLFVIVRLAFPAAKKVIVLDPAKVVMKNYNSGFLYAYTRDQVMSLSNEKNPFLLINMSGAPSVSFPFNFAIIEGIISFNDIDESSLDFFHYSLCYVVDQQNKIKWLISENHIQTDFLNDYYQSQFTTDVSNLFSGFSWLMNYLKIKRGNLKKVTDGSCQILKKDRHFFASIDNDQYDSYTINFDSHFAKGIIRIRLYNKAKYTWVMNHAIDLEGKEKIANENKVLSEISKKKYSHIGIPEFFASDYNIVYKFDKTCKTSDSLQTKKLLERVFTNAVLEFQSDYIREFSLKTFWKGKHILNDIAWIRSRIAQDQIPRGISALNLAKLYSNIVQIFNDFDLNESVFLSLNNNHLYSENIFSSKDKLYFTSWVNADFDLPLFFDLFQKALFRADEMATADSEIMCNSIQRELEKEILNNFASQYNINIGLQFKVFLTITFIAELKLLLIKKMVLPETNVKLFNWLELSNRYLTN